MERKSSVNEFFKTRFPYKTIGNELFFKAPGGMVFTVEVFAHFRAIFMEWADSFEKVIGGREDGDLFSIELSEEDMIQEMLQEIES